MKNIKSVLLSLFIVSSLIPTLTFATGSFPAGQYTVAFYNEFGAGTGTQGICLEGSGSTGTWYSDTFSAWSGKWFRKGNDIHLHGNYADGQGNDAFELTRISSQLLTGYWQEWRDDGSHDAYVTAKFGFKKAKCNPPVAVRATPDGNPTQGQEQEQEQEQ